MTLGKSVATTWAVCLPLDKGAALGRFRTTPGLFVSLAERHLWVRVESANDALLELLRTLPGRRYQVLDDGQLLPAGGRVPEGYLPQGDWTPLDRCLPVETPTAGFAGRLRNRVQLRLARGGRPAEANVLLTTFSAWRRWASTAPAIRLQRLAFACDRFDRVVVWGSPPPPIAGPRFMERSGLALPAGHRFDPPVDPAIIRDLLDLADGDLALFFGEQESLGLQEFSGEPGIPTELGVPTELGDAGPVGDAPGSASGSGASAASESDAGPCWELVRAADFVRASRSAVRLTDAARAGGGHEA